jgi:hypothetical protein
LITNDNLSRSQFIVVDVFIIIDDNYIIDVLLRARRRSSALTVARALLCSARAFAVVSIVHIEIE